jgi:hypothetical protein
MVFGKEDRKQGIQKSSQEMGGPCSLRIDTMVFGKEDRKQGIQSLGQEGSASDF